MLYLIGLGLNEKSISIEGIEAIKKCKKIYLENYTINFPYEIKEIEKIIERKIEKLDRVSVESDKIINEAKKDDICLLIYGSPLFATTHISLIIDAEKSKVKYKVIFSASVFDAIAETGLQMYKFGKISSMPSWQKNYEPHSFLDFVEQNQSINAHSIILVDIGLSFEKAINQLIKVSLIKNIKIDRIIVCSNLGTKKSKIYYGTLEKLKRIKIESPFCFIIPAEMHFIEKEFIERYSV
ncbi:MAG: diphthine synthase [Candidatus Pacearchaeota archaeon]